MNIREMRIRIGDTQSEFSKRYNIPFRTIQNWESGIRKPPEYLLQLLEKQINTDIINKKTILLPKFDPNKINLPKRSDYVGALSWLKAVQDFIGSPFVFALDEALMCDGSFGGRNDEYLVWLYGDDSLSRFNGVVVLGNNISKYCVKDKDGLRYTDLNRTLYDALSNESLLDMQGITEAVSRYYYQNNECFDGILVPPEYQDNFDALALDAINYYSE